MQAIEVPIREISGGWKNGGRKGVGSAIRRGRANRGGVHIEKKERRVVVKKEVDPHIIRIRDQAKKERR